MTTKNSRSRHANAAGVPPTNLEHSDRTQSIRLPGPDSLSPYRSELNRALSEYNLGDFDEAKSILITLSASLKRILTHETKYNDSAQLHLLYASTLTSLGRTCERLKEESEATRAFKNAEGEFRKWIPESKEPNDQMYLDYGVALFKTGSKRRTIQIFSKSGTLNAEGNRYMGICLGRLGKYKEAEERFRDALRQDPDHYMTHKALAELLEEQGKISEAVEEYDTTFRYMADSGLLDDSLEMLQHILKLTRQDSRWLAHKGEILRVKGDFNGAKRALDRSLKQRPRDAFATGVKGLVLLAMGRDDEGIRLLERALRLDPTIDWIPVELAVALYNLGLYKKALSALNKALVSDPNNVSALFRKGETLTALGQNDEALLALDEALKLKPNDALVLGLKGRVLRKLNHHKKALKVLQRSIDLDRTIAWVHAELGAVLYGLGDNDNALQAVINALAIQPDNVLALGYKAEILRARHQSEEALQVLNQALALSPNDARNVGTKGQVLRDLGREDEAIKMLRQAINLDPTLAWVHVELSSVHYNLGHYLPALEALENALRIQKDSDWQVFQAHILCEIARFDAAVKLLNQVTQTNKNIAEAFGLKGWALQHLGVKQAKKALQAYESAKKLEPDNLWWHKGIANVLYLMNDKEKALAKYDWVVKQAKQQAENEGDEAKFLSLVAWCQYRLGKYQEAVELFNQVISFSPEQIASQFDLALALASCKRYGEAFREYNRGVRSSQEQPALRNRCLTYIALDDLKTAIRMQPELELAEAEEIRGVLALLEATYNESSDDNMSGQR